LTASAKTSTFNRPILSWVGWIRFLNANIIHVAFMWILLHGQSVAAPDVDDLVTLGLFSWYKSPSSSLIVVFVVNRGNGSGSQVFHHNLALSILANAVKEEGVPVSVIPLLGNENLVPWTLFKSLVSNDWGGASPGIVAGALATVINHSLELLVDQDNLALPSEKGWGAVSFAARNALTVLLVPVLIPWALYLGPFASVRVALKVAHTTVGSWSLLVLI